MSRGGCPGGNHSESLSGNGDRTCDGRDPVPRSEQARWERWQIMGGSMVIACPECKKKFKGREELEGKTVRCPSCKHNFVVPGPAADKSASKPAAAPAAAQPKRGTTWDEEDEDSNPYGVTDL